MGPDDRAEAKSKVGQRSKGGGICRSAMDLGSREEEKILGPVSRCGVRREEEIGARLSDGSYMNSTGLIDNPESDMSAMRFCRAWSNQKGKKKGPARGESRALRRTGTRPVRRERSGRKGGRRNTRCDGWAYRGDVAVRQSASGYVCHAKHAWEAKKDNDINDHALQYGELPRFWRAICDRV